MFDSGRAGADGIGIDIDIGIGIGIGGALGAICPISICWARGWSVTIGLGYEIVNTLEAGSTSRIG